MATFQKNQESYLRILREELEPVMPFKISFRGIQCVQSGMVMLGYPNVELNVVREKIVKRFQEQGLVYRVYNNNIVHSTIMRFANTGTDQSIDDIFAKQELGGKTWDFGNRYRETWFGTLNVNSLTLASASWRMRPYEIQQFATITATPQSTQQGKKRGREDEKT